MSATSTPVKHKLTAAERADSPAKKAKRAPSPSPEDEEMIHFQIFRRFEAFRQRGEENSLMFFVRNPEFEVCGPWIMQNYSKAKKACAAIEQLFKLSREANDIDSATLKALKEDACLSRASLLPTDKDLQKLLSSNGASPIDELARVVALLWCRDADDLAVRMQTAYDNGVYPSIRIKDELWTSPIWTCSILAKRRRASRTALYY